MKIFSKAWGLCFFNVYLVLTHCDSFVLAPFWSKKTKQDYEFKVLTFSFDLRVFASTSNELCRSCRPFLLYEP